MRSSLMCRLLQDPNGSQISDMGSDSSHRSAGSLRPHHSLLHRTGSMLPWCRILFQAPACWSDPSFRHSLDEVHVPHPQIKSCCCTVCSTLLFPVRTRSECAPAYHGAEWNRHPVWNGFRSPRDRTVQWDSCRPPCRCRWSQTPVQNRNLSYRVWMQR